MECPEGCAREALGHDDDQPNLHRRCDEVAVAGCLVMQSVHHQPHLESDFVLTPRRESCVIMPHSIRMRRKGGAPIDMGDQATDSSNSRATTANTVEAKSARMVDYGFGLKLEHKLMKTITDAFKEFYDYQKSLNQSMSFIKSVPFFLDIEVKKKHQVRTPEVQLAIWAAALYKKRQHHGWDVQIPMPGICINGHVWEFYIIFETGEDELVCLTCNSRLTNTLTWF